VTDYNVKLQFVNNLTLFTKCNFAQMATAAFSDK